MAVDLYHYFFDFALSRTFVERPLSPLYISIGYYTSEYSSQLRKALINRFTFFPLRSYTKRGTYGIGQ